jgi:hypothetical protein
LPKEWSVDQIRQFQDYFDALMSGNSSRRRMLKFMPADFHLQETRQPPLKDQYDEWLARLICYAFSVPASPFVSSVNRATGETLRLQATQEGLIPLRAWIKDAMDRILQTYLAAPDLEFVWVGDDAVDPLQQAQTLQILVGAGIKTKDEARAELGLAAGGGEPSGTELGKFNPYHDPRDGQFTTADGAGGAADDARVMLAADSTESKAIPLTAPDQPERPDLQSLQALTNNPAVRSAIIAAWMGSAGSPPDVREQSFYILRDPATGAVSTSPMQTGSSHTLFMSTPPDNAIAMFHTHPNATGSLAVVDGKLQSDVNGKPLVWLPGPSDGDINSTNRSKLPGLIATDRGIYYYGPTLKPIK